MTDTPTIGASADQPSTLGELLASRPVKNEASARQNLLTFLASQGGSAFAVEAKRGGHSEATMLAALAEDAHDRRKKPVIDADLIGGHEVIWLTTPGWKAAGHPSKREVRPTTETLAHADAPRLLRSWLARQISPLADHASIEVVSDPKAISDISEAAKARAWARLRTAADSDGGIGSLTSGIRPDALIIERWWHLPTFASAYGLENPSAEEAAEVTWAIEIEDTTKGLAALREKIARHDAAAEVGVLRGTIWITRTAATARALAAFGIGATSGHPRAHHLAVRAYEVEIPGGEMVQPAGQRWWPLRLTAQRPRTAFGVE